MNTMDSQDLQAMTEVAKNKIIERLVTKYDVQVACDSARNKILGSMQEIQLENQAAIRQLNAHADQSWRKISSLDDRISGLQQDIRLLQQMLGQLLQDERTVYQPSDFSVPLPVK